MYIVFNKVEDEIRVKFGAHKPVEINPRENQMSPSGVSSVLSL